MDYVAYDGRPVRNIDLGTRRNPKLATAAGFTSRSKPATWDKIFGGSPVGWLDLVIVSRVNECQCEHSLLLQVGLIDTGG